MCSCTDGSRNNSNDSSRRCCKSNSRGWCAARGHNHAVGRVERHETQRRMSMLRRNRICVGVALVGKAELRIPLQRLRWQRPCVEARASHCVIASLKPFLGCNCGFNPNVSTNAHSHSVSYDVLCCAHAPDHPKRIWPTIPTQPTRQYL
jgi:hypothetical protein